MKKIISPLILPLCVSAILLLTGCAAPVTLSPKGTKAEISKEVRKQKELVLKKYLAEDLRVQNMGYTFLRTNASLCSKSRYDPGFTYWNKSFITKDFQDTANILYGLGNVPQVQAVLKNSPAARAGIKTGDKLIAINGKEISLGSKSSKSIKALMKAVKDPEVKITLSRDGEEEIIKKVKRVKICDYGVLYQSDKLAVNAYADGESIFISRGMLRFTENEKELALIVGHELAHNTMGHIDKKYMNAGLASLGGFAVDLLAAAGGYNTQGQFTNMAIQAGAGVHSVAFEQEADYVGMYYMARAGYDTNGAGNFWRRMSAEYNESNLKDRSSHPANAERFIAIKKTHEEIQEKKKNGHDLEPDLLAYTKAESTEDETEPDDSLND